MNIETIEELAHDARLDWGLAEVVGGIAPPDLSRRITERIHARRARARRRGTWLRAAALVALAFGAVVATRLQQGSRDGIPAARPGVGEPVRVASSDEIDALAETTTNVEGVDLTVEELERLAARCPDLLRLHLIALSARRDADPSDESLARISELRSLRELRIDSASSLSSRGLELLTDLPMLETLALNGLYGSDLRLEFLERLPLLTDLTIRSSPTLEGGPSSGPFDVVFGLARLERLDLSGCTQLSSMELARVVELRRLRELVLDGHDGIDSTNRPPGRRQRREGYGVTPRVTAAIAELPELASLTLANCNIDDGALGALTPSVSLTRLDIHGNPRITEVGVTALLESRPIEWLDLRDCLDIEPELFDVLRREESLRYLDIRRTRLVEPSRIEKLRQLPHLETLRYGGPSQTLRPRRR